MVDTLQTELVMALKKAVNELNEIRARDGVPYMWDGTKSSVCPQYFSDVIDECFAVIDKVEVASKEP